MAFATAPNYREFWNDNGGKSRISILVTVDSYRRSLKTYKENVD